MQKMILFSVLISLALSSCSLDTSKDYYAWNYPMALESNGLVI